MIAPRPLAALAALGLCAAALAAAQGFQPPVPMAKYQFGLLRRGPGWTPRRTPATDSIQAGHLANLQRMAAEGVLLGAGPCLDGGDLRGILILRDDSVATLRRLTARDPAIQAQRLTLDLHPWFAPAGIGERYFARWKQPGFRDSMVRYQLVLLRHGPASAPLAAPETQKLQREHVANLFRLLLSGAAASAGPLQGAGDLAGVLVFRGDSATSWRIAQEDPAVRAGRLTAEMHPWTSAWGVFPGDTL